MGYCVNLVPQNATGNGPLAAQICTSTTGTKPIVLVQKPMTLKAYPPYEGVVINFATYPAVPSGKLEFIELHHPGNNSQLAGVYLIPPGASPDTACFDPNQRVFLPMEGNIVGGNDMVKLYGSLTPSMEAGLTVSGCALYNNGLPQGLPDVLIDLDILEPRNP